MALVLDAFLFVKNIQKLKNCTCAESIGCDDDMNKYLFEHYLIPMSEGKEVTVGELDFSEFDRDDIRTLSALINNANDRSRYLGDICHTMKKTTPIALPTKAFC